MYTPIYGCANYGSCGFEELCKISDPSPILGWIYFVNFAFLATFEFLNLIIGIIISNMDDLKEKGRLKLDPELAKLGKKQANIKVPLNKIKKDMARLETHVAILEEIEQQKPKQS